MPGFAFRSLPCRAASAAELRYALHSSIPRGCCRRAAINARHGKHSCRRFWKTRRCFRGAPIPARSTARPARTDDVSSSRTFSLSGRLTKPVSARRRNQRRDACAPKIHITRVRSAFRVDKARVSEYVHLNTDATIKELLASLRDIRDKADAVLRRTELVTEQRSLAWRCIGCGYIKHFTRAALAEVAAPCPKCNGDRFDPSTTAPS
jgi:hypothetical protein